jgi:hypothetical protein
MSKTSAEGRIILFDSDHSYPAVKNPDMDKVIEVIDVDHWEYAEWIPAIHRVRKEVGRDDWVVVDMVDKAWSGAQNYYWQTVRGGNSLGEIYLRNQKDDSFSMGGEYGANWGVINHLYDDFFGTFTSLDCHRMALAPASEVQVNQRTGRSLNAWDADVARFRYKPVGQRRLKHSFHTVLLAQELLGEREVEYTLTTVKEQGPLNYSKRKYLAGEKVSEEGGFVGTYLIGVGGWLP